MHSCSSTRGVVETGLALAPSEVRLVEQGSSSEQGLRERLLEVVEAMIYGAMSSLMLRRLAKGAV
jgi:hypothetical protein